VRIHPLWVIAGVLIIVVLVPNLLTILVVVARIGAVYWFIMAASLSTRPFQFGENIY
jgi:hypothetical protein